MVVLGSLQCWPIQSVLEISTNRWSVGQVSIALCYWRRGEGVGSEGCGE